MALNCVANGKLLRDGQLRRIWIQPAAGDAGGALGAALRRIICISRQPRSSATGDDGMDGAYLGPAYAADDIERA